MEGDAGGAALRIFLTIVAIGVIALAATSPFALRVRRIRPIMMLASGGWFGVALGMLLGRSGTGVIDPATVLRLTPIGVLGLGWIGLLVGIQVRKEVLQRIPAQTHSLGLLDGVMSSLVFGILAFFGLRYWTGADEFAPIIGGVAAIAFGSISWSVETRSLGIRDTATDHQLSMIIRAAGGLGATLGVGLFGIATVFQIRDALGAAEIDLVNGGIRLLICALIALAMGLLGRLGLRYAGRSSAEQLVVFLGVVSLGAGVSIQFGISPLFCCMLCGIVIANLPGTSLRSLERFILRAEQVVATLAWIFIGIILDISIGPAGLALAAGIGGARLLLKPILFRLLMHKSIDVEDATPRLSLAPMRQCPLALIMGMGLYLAEPSSFHAKLLGVLVIAGLIGALGPMTHTVITSAVEAHRAKSAQEVRA